MNPIPPLPFVDGVFLIDNSTIERLVCPRLYQLSSLNKRELAVARAGRNFGSTLHIGWKERYRLCGVNAVTHEHTDSIRKVMSNWLQENPQPIDDFRSYDHACRVMDAYNNHYGNEPFSIMLNADGTPAIEASFMFKIGDVPYYKITDTGKIAGVSWVYWYPVYYIGRTDLFTTNSSGEWVLDHKTAFMFGSQFEAEMRMNSGQLGYCWAFKQFYGHYPRGYIIDAVRIRRPKRSDEYTGEAPCDSSDFMRLPYMVMPDTIEEWRESVLAHVQTIFHYHSNGLFPMQRKMCVTKYGTCGMYDVCNAPRASRDNILASSQFVDYNWSPLNKPNKEKETTV